MTVQVQTPLQQSSGNGVTTVFPFNFKVLAKTDLTVTVDGGGKVVDVDYSVAGVGNDTGSITFLSGAPANGAVVSILRTMRQERLTDYQNAGDFNASTVNPDFDRAILLSQDIAAVLSRAITAPITELTSVMDLPAKSARANKYLRFNVNGDVEMADVTGSGTVLSQSIIGQFYRPAIPAEAGITIVNFFYDWLDVRRYGAVLDGVTDDGVAFGRARDVAFAMGGGEVTFTGPSVLRNLTWKDRVSLRGIGNPTINGNPAVASDVVFLMQGTTGVATALTANVAQGAKIVPVTSTAGLAIGDYVIVRENTYIQNPDGRKQQITKITNIAGANVTLANSLFDPYTTAAAAELVKLNPISRFKMSGFTVANASAVNGGGFDMLYCVDYELDVTVTGTSGAAAFKRTTCAFGKERVTVNDTQGGSPGSSIGLGLFTLNCHNLATHFTGRNYTENSFEMRSRWCTYSGIHQNVKDSAVNTHGNGNHDILIHDFVVDGSDNVGVAISHGAALTGDTRITVRNGKIRNTASHGFSMSGSVGKESKFCKVFGVEASACKLTSVAATYGFFFSWGIDTEVGELQVDGTTVGNAPDAGIGFANCVNTTLDGFKVANVTAGWGVQTQTCQDTTVKGGQFKNISSDNVHSTGSTGFLRLINNTSDDKQISVDLATCYSAGNTWDSDTFTQALTGMTGTVNLTVNILRIGRQLMINFPSGASGTSNATTMTLPGGVPGLPAFHWPQVAQRVRAISVADNSVNKLGRVTVGTDGTFTFSTDFDGAAFTAAGSKGVSIGTFAISLD